MVPAVATASQIRVESILTIAALDIDLGAYSQAKTGQHGGRVGLDSKGTASVARLLVWVVGRPGLWLQTAVTLKRPKTAKTNEKEERETRGKREVSRRRREEWRAEAPRGDKGADVEGARTAERRHKRTGEARVTKRRIFQFFFAQQPAVEEKKAEKN